jgi:NAD(P)-dependent dehydrogenase (short-subunit alcohol dehydrogenase family)
MATQQETRPGQRPERRLDRSDPLAAGRGALITGGASGIGLAMAATFAALGLRIILCDRDEPALASAAAGLRAAGAAVLAIPLDVADRDAWGRAAAEIRRFAPLAIACANAGVAPAGAPLCEMSPQAWDRIVAINLTGVFNTVQTTVPLIREQGAGGHLVLTSSMAGMIAAAPIGDYAATKFAVGALGEALRGELADHGIGVSVLYPGVVATPLVGESRAAGMPPASVARRAADAIAADELFVFTHDDYRPLLEARLASILAAFGPSAEPGFQEAGSVLRMMTPAA